MKKEELRIGNYVIDNLGGILKIKGIGTESCTGHLNPIRLNEEWLLKFGFVKDEYQAEECGEDVGDLYVLNNFMICKKEGVFYNYIEIDGDKFYSFCSTELTSVHKLQNLFYAITTTELTYEMES